MLQEMEETARSGHPLASVLHKTSQFPQPGSQMIAIGEETGQLSIMLEHVSKLLRMDLEEQTSKVLQSIGPMLIMGLGLMIGLVAAGVLLPILEVGRGLQ